MGTATSYIVGLMERRWIHWNSLCWCCIFQFEQRYRRKTTQTWRTVSLSELKPSVILMVGISKQVQHQRCSLRICPFHKLRRNWKLKGKQFWKIGPKWREFQHSRPFQCHSYPFLVGNLALPARSCLGTCCRSYPGSAKSWYPGMKVDKSVQ